MQGRAAVVGVGESAYYERGRSPDSEFQLACTAVRNAVEDAGLRLADVDGFVSYMDPRNDPPRLCAALGIPHLRWSAQPWGGGGNGMAAAVMLADAAVSSGYAEVVVAFRALAQGQFGRFGQSRGLGGRVPAPMAFASVYGLLSPAQQCALHTARFLHDHHVSPDALGEITLACYANAQRNPRALRYGQPLDWERYRSARWIVEPFRLYDCCPENDGAAAVVVTSRERARDLRRRPVPILAAAQGAGPAYGQDWYGASFPSAHYREVGRTLWERAAVGPADVDVVQLYENFTGPVLIALCEMGFAAPEEVGDFVAGGALAGPEARLPFNTSGGNLGEAYIHGFELVNEAVRQVRGESTCQVADVQLSLAVAGPGYSPGSAVLFCAP